MTQEFVTYEQALALKELGFDENTFADYYVFGDGKLRNGKYGQTEPMLFTKDLDLDERCDELGMFCYHDVSVPLKQQVFRWFREKYGLSAQFAYYHVPKWTFEILEFTDIKMTPSKIVCEYSKPRIYEEAESACIDKLIEIVKHKQ